MTLIDSEQTCDDCGLAYDTWAAENSLWNAVMPSSAGMLCTRCFGAKARAEGFIPFIVMYPYPVNLAAEGERRDDTR